MRHSPGECFPGLEWIVPRIPETFRRFHASENRDPQQGIWLIESSSQGVPFRPFGGSLRHREMAAAFDSSQQGPRGR
jgi:hypothetical protein